MPATFRYELINFIADNLPRWRDDPERRYNTSETKLTEHLCDYLSSAARMSAGWDILQFRSEAADEDRKGRKIDIAPKPCGATIWIEGRRYAQYDALLPIECKRLPTPKGDDRDEREYVISKYSSTGGIQRFKAGHHGSKHPVGAMIAYVQENTSMFWHSRISGWINDLAEFGEEGWTTTDLLHVERNDESLRLTVLRSTHGRKRGAAIELRHLWIEMN